MRRITLDFIAIIIIMIIIIIIIISIIICCNKFVFQYMLRMKLDDEVVFEAKGLVCLWFYAHEL